MSSRQRPSRNDADLSTLRPGASSGEVLVSNWGAGRILWGVRRCRTRVLGTERGDMRRRADPFILLDSQAGIGTWSGVARSRHTASPVD
jgi:hypothetical protein